MSTCVGYNCTSRSSKKTPGVTFHRFPKDKYRQLLWVKAVRRKNFTPKVHSKLCSKHFSEDMIDRTSLSCVRLREHAIPSIFDFSPHLQKNNRLDRRRLLKHDAVPSLSPHRARPKVRKPSTYFSNKTKCIPMKKILKTNSAQHSSKVEKIQVLPHGVVENNDSTQLKKRKQVVSQENGSGVTQCKRESENAASMIMSLDTLIYENASLTEENVMPAIQIKTEIESPSRDDSPGEQHDSYEERVLPDPVIETVSEAKSSPSLDTSILVSKYSIPSKKLKTLHPSDKGVQLQSAYSLSSVQFDNSEETPSYSEAKQNEIRYDLLGRNWAEKIKTLRKDQRIFAEKLINDVLYEAEWCHLNHGCRIQNSG